MDKRVRFLLPLVFLSCCKLSAAADSRFDLIGPKIDVRNYRGGQTLPIADVPNLQPGDKLGFDRIFLQRNRSTIC